MTKDKNFEVAGSYLQHGQATKFTKFVSAHNESFAKEKTFTMFGSKQGLPRRNIKIESVKVAAASSKK